MIDRLPPLRRTRRRINLADLAKRLSKGVAKVDATVEPFAAFWDEWNHDQLHAEGPLWVALGDSVTQGVGASSPEASYAMLTYTKLRETTGRPWRLINLSMSGGRFADVIEHQLPTMAAASLQPDAVSAIVGSNDVIWRRNRRAIVHDARALVDLLPEATLLSQVSDSQGDLRRRSVNKVFQQAGGDGKIHLFNAWAWPTMRGMWAEDKFHPNDKAYIEMHRNVWDAFTARGII